MPKKLAIHTLVSPSFGQNAYVLSLEGSNECVVVDPGFDAEEIEKHVIRRQLTPRALLNTHGHIDHIAGNQWMKTCWADCPIVIGKEDAPKLLDPSANLSSQFGVGLTSPRADILVVHEDVYEAAGITLHVIGIPGHSRGHVVYLWKEDDPWIVLGGDVLFQGGVGRTDFADGDTRLLFTSIRNRLFTLPDDTVVLPGHGPSTTIGVEKRDNPFVGQRPMV
jgi:glyoxylase-like metal-dependent hydrolase (beta-lactamase superfamily II)